MTLIQSTRTTTTRTTRLTSPRSPNAIAFGELTPPAITSRTFPSPCGFHPAERSVQADDPASVGHHPPAPG
jgi:hypothetical protein